MLTLPPLLIVTDRGHFSAWQLHGDSGPELVERATFIEGTEKISSQLTDKAGAFPAGESLGQGTSAAERLPLEAELSMRCIRQIGQHIRDLLVSHSGPWGLAAPGEINNTILAELDAAHTSRLRLNLTKNIAKAPANEVIAHFERAREEVHAAL